MIVTFSKQALLDANNHRYDEGFTEFLASVGESRRYIQLIDEHSLVHFLNLAYNAGRKHEEEYWKGRV